MQLKIEETNITESITRVLIELGIPAHLRGYYYLRDAVEMTMKDLELVGSVTKLLYPQIGKKYKCTSQRVERAIRNSIEVSWERGNPQLMENLFGYSKEDGKRRPTNSEYIVALADKLRRELQLNSTR